MILLSDENYVLKFEQPSTVTPSLVAKAALGLLMREMMFEKSVILDHKGNPTRSHRRIDSIKIRKPVRFDNG